MRPIVDGRIVIGKAYEGACVVADMADGPEKEKAKKAWAKKYNFSRFPRVLFRGNPNARDYCERSPDSGINISNTPGRFLIEPQS